MKLDINDGENINNTNSEHISRVNDVQVVVKSDVHSISRAFEKGASEEAKEPQVLNALPVKTSKTRSAKSSYFDSNSQEEESRSLGGKVSFIQCPPLSSPSFGLLQEKLANDPFKLLIGVTFLIKTAGRNSIPVFYQLLERYPRLEDLANAKKADIVELTRHLGLQNSRANTYIKYANIFLHDRPVKSKRYRVENYPVKNAHHGIVKGEVLADNEEDPREGAWEIGHLTKGAYALDSWRIFCRDKVRELADNWNGEGAKEGFQPEWMRVLPQDKELRAFLRWCWLREGWLWSADTGEKEVAPRSFIGAVNEGRVYWEWNGSGSGKARGSWKIQPQESATV